jgi:hypothetical protein
MSANDKQNKESKKTTRVENEEKQNEHEVKETELNIEHLEDRIAPATFVV